MRRKLWTRALIDTLPVLFGYVPLGMAFGFMMSASGYAPGVSLSRARLSTPGRRSIWP